MAYEKERKTVEKAETVEEAENVGIETRIETEEKKMSEMRKENTKKLKGIRQFLREEEGMGTVEVILIIVVLVGLVIIFKDQITKIVNNLFDRITTQTGRV